MGNGSSGRGGVDVGGGASITSGFEMMVYAFFEKQCLMFVERCGRMSL